MVAEVVAGLVAGSLALLADAGHMLTDAARARRRARRRRAGGAARARAAGRSASRRREILAAQVNGLTLLLVGVWIVYGGRAPAVDPPEVHGGIVLVVALAGVAVNLAATALLARREPREPQRPRRVPPRRDRPRRVRRHRGRRRARARDRLGPLRPAREPARRGADALGRAGRSCATRRGSSSRARRGSIDPDEVGRALAGRPASSRCTTSTSGR